MKLTSQGSPNSRLLTCAFQWATLAHTFDLNQHARYFHPDYANSEHSSRPVERRTVKDVMRLFLKNKFDLNKVRRFAMYHVHHELDAAKCAAWSEVYFGPTCGRFT